MTVTTAVKVVTAVSVVSVFPVVKIVTGVTEVPVVTKAPQNKFLLLSHIFYVKCSVKVRKFVLYEFATKREFIFLFLQFLLILYTFF